MDKQIQELYGIFRSFPKVCTDSRKVEEGSLFFALKGPNFDGNKYVQNALSQGAAVAIIDDNDYSIEGKTFLVPDVLEALQELSKYHRAQLKIPIIGITGSNGKTTSKELINCVLSTGYKVAATQGNLNNHIGVPISILSINDTHDIGIIEMGANGHGEIKFLCEMAQPTHGLITSIGKAHLQGFGDLDGVIQEKTALYRSIASNHGIIIYNADSIYLPKHLPENTLNVAYNNHGCHSFELGIISTFPSINGTCKRGLLEVALSSGMYGDYNVSNISSSLTIGALFDIPLEKGVYAINDYKPKNNRSELREFQGAEIYLDAYNANPSSVALIVDQFAKSVGYKILVLGDMLEVGDQEDEEHHEILNKIDPEGFEEVLLFGSLYAKHNKAFSSFRFFTEFENLKSYFDSLNLEGKGVLLKGSRGMRLERLIT